MTTEVIITQAAACTVEVTSQQGATIELGITSIGIKGEPGPNKIGGYDVSLTNIGDGDVLQFVNDEWVNTPQVILVDGGAF